MFVWKADTKGQQIFIGIIVGVVTVVGEKLKVGAKELMYIGVIPTGIIVKINALENTVRLDIIEIGGMVGGLVGLVKEESSVGTRSMHVTGGKNILLVQEDINGQVLLIKALRIIVINKLPI